jgi:putative membrane protein
MLRDGFLGYRASLMLDVVVVALLLVVPILLFSLIAVKWQHKYQLHKTLQVVLGIVLLLAVAAFEIDLHLVQGGWERVVAKQTPALSAEQMAHVRTVLRIHLLFATTTPVLWALTIGMALRYFPSPLKPSPHSRLHAKLGWLSAADITLTSVTGLWFYYTAFISP